MQQCNSAKVDTATEQVKLAIKLLVDIRKLLDVEFPVTVQTAPIGAQKITPISTQSIAPIIAPYQ